MPDPDQTPPPESGGKPPPPPSPRPPTPLPPPPGPERPDPVDDRGFIEAEKAREEAEELRRKAQELESNNASLRAQVDELQALAARNPDDEPPKDLQRLHLLQIQPIRDVLVILLVLGVFWLGYILRPITVPMLLALMLAYLVEPVVRRLVRGRYMTRMQAAASVILIVVLVLTVPLAVGTTLAVSQGVRTTRTVTDNIGYIQALIKNPTDKATLGKLEDSGKPWLLLGKALAGVANPKPTEEELEAEKRLEEERRAEREAEQAEEKRRDVPDAPGTPISDERGDPDPTPGTDPTGEPSGVGSSPSEQPAVTAGAKGGENEAQAASQAESAIEPGGGLASRASNWISGAFESNLQSLGRFAARYLVGTSSSAVEIGVKAVKAIFLLVFGLFLVLFFFFFFCTGYERVTSSIANLIPKWKRNRTLELLRQMDLVIAGFVRGRLIIMGILMVLFTVGYWFIGVPTPLVVGPVTGILAVVPYLGMISIPASMLLMWLQPVGPQWQQTWWWILIAPIVLYFIIQTVEDYVLTPLIQGKSTDMDTPSILFAVLAGGILAGFYGVLLAIPAAACIKILLREAFWPRFKAWAEGRVKDFLPISRYDPTEAHASAPSPPPTPKAPQKP